MLSSFFWDRKKEAFENYFSIIPSSFAWRRYFKALFLLTFAISIIFWLVTFSLFSFNCLIALYTFSFVLLALSCEFF